MPPEPLTVVPELEPLAGEVEVLPPAGDPGPRRARRLRPRSVVRTVAAAWLVAVALVCLVGPLLPMPDPNFGYDEIAARPGGSHLLGTDQLGRDVFSRLVHGGRVSFLVVAASILIAGTVGLALGIAAGYFRGVVDVVARGLSDLVLAFPTLILLIVLTAIFGLSIRNLIMGLSIVITPGFLRVARAHSLSVSRREFILAAKGSGTRVPRILYRHVLPVVLPPVLTYALTIGGVLFVAEGALSFLGLGVPPPDASWGSMIASSQAWVSRAPHIMLVPSVTLVLTVLAFNYLGERDGRATAGRRR